MVKKPEPADLYDIPDEDVGAGLENISIFERDFPGREEEPTLAHWLLAFEHIDKRGDKELLLYLLLKSNFPLERRARVYLADLLKRYELKKPRGRSRTPAYDRTEIERELERASSEVKDRVKRGMSVKNALDEVSKSNLIDLQTLAAHYGGRRGSTRRMRRHRP